MKIKYLVTGAAGHLGMNIVNELIKNNKLVKVLVLPNEKNIDKFPKQIEICYGDITNKLDLDNFFKNDGYEHIVIHSAGIVSISSKYNELVYNVNVNGVKNIVDYCIKYKVKRLIHISSVHAIKEEKNNEIIKETKVFSPNYVVGLYAKTKAEASQYVIDAMKKIDAIIIHPSGIFGPYDYAKGHLSQLLIDYCNNKLTAAVDGGYDFVDARDVAKAVITATTTKHVNECFIISNKYYKIKEILDIASNITKHKKIKIFLPIWFAKLTAPLSELYYKILKQPPLYTTYSLYTLSSNSNFSHDKATKLLNYKPREMKETIKDTIEFLKKENRIK